jgi:hypothetical protein
MFCSVGRSSAVSLTVATKRDVALLETIESYNNTHIQRLHDMTVAELAAFTYAQMTRPRTITVATPLCHH